MPSAVARFQSAEVFENNAGTFVNLDNMNDAAGAATEAIISSETRPTVNSVVLSGLDLPEDFGALDGNLTLVISHDWTEVGKTVDSLRVYSREGSGSWTFRDAVEGSLAGGALVLVFPVVDPSSLQVLVELFHAASGASDPPLPPTSA